MSRLSSYFRRPYVKSFILFMSIGFVVSLFFIISLLFDQVLEYERGSNWFRQSKIDNIIRWISILIIFIYPAFIMPLLDWALTSFKIWKDSKESFRITQTTTNVIGYLLGGVAGVFFLGALGLSWAILKGLFYLGRFIVGLF